jgi:CBS domain-containing protein
MLAADAMSSRLVTARPDERVHTAIARMLEEQVGSVVVCEEGRLVGVFTERDVLRLAGGGSAFGELRLGDVMTKQVIVVDTEDDLLAAARMMSEKRIRHLPVVQGDHVLGMLGIREVLRTLVERLWSNRDEEARETARELLRPG